jgi:integrase
MGLLPTLGATFTFRRYDSGRRAPGETPGRALPSHVIAQLDTQLDLLRAVPGSTEGSSHRSLGVLGERAGDMAVLAYELLKGTGRRVGEITSLHLECLDVDEHDMPVLVYDNHKTARIGRRLPLADTALVGAIRAQQAWVADRFPDTVPERLWLLPRASKNADGTAHLSGHQILVWMHSWVAALPHLDAGTLDDAGSPVPFDRAAVHPHAFRHFVPAKSLCRDWLMEALSAGGLWPGHPRVVFGEGLRSAAHACLLDLVLLPRFRVLGHRTAPIDPRGDAGFDRLRLGVRGRAGVTALYDGGESVAA